MNEPAETREESKHSGGFGSYALWAGVVLVLYVLSFGPYEMVRQKGRWQNHRLIDIAYSPLWVGYNNTPLHKSLGRYLHLWSPQGYDINGEPHMIHIDMVE